MNPRAARLLAVIAKRGLWLAATAAIVLAVGWYFWPLLSPAWTNDVCTFEGVPEGRYQIYTDHAQRAAERDREAMTQAIRDGRSDIAVQLMQQEFDELSLGVKLVRERIAVMHAVLRANRAEYVYAEPDTEDPFADAEASISRGRIFPDGTTQTWSVIFRYRLNLLRYGVINPFLQRAVIHSSFVLSTEFFGTFDHAPGLENVFQIALFLPHWPKGAPALGRGGTACPPVPSRQWEERYLATRTGGLG